MKIAHITAVIGGIDEQKEVPKQTLCADRYFYDKPALLQFNDRIEALFYKQQHHNLLPDYDLYIWTDGKVQIVANDFYEQLVNQLGENEIGILKHHERKCIYTETDHIYHCISKGNEYLRVRYEHRPLRTQVEQYRSMGYPVNNGLNDCCIFITRNTETVRNIFNKWWLVCSKYDHFDQTAIQYICWKAGVKIVPIEFRKGSFIDVPHKVLK